MEVGKCLCVGPLSSGCSHGRRVLDDTSPHLYEQGDYGLWAGRWNGRPPHPEYLTANLAAHDVTEHADGTITVSPSILVQRGPGGPTWHGWLERGVWREG